MAGLKVTSCAHDNPITNQKDILSLYIYHFQYNLGVIFPADLLRITKKTLCLLGDHAKTVLLSRSFKWTLKQKSHRHIYRTIPLLLISQLLSRCRFPSKHYHMYILGLWQCEKLHFCFCPTPWQHFKLVRERNSNGKLAAPTTSHML